MGGARGCGIHTGQKEKVGVAWSVVGEGPKMWVELACELGSRFSQKTLSFLVLHIVPLIFVVYVRSGAGETAEREKLCSFG